MANQRQYEPATIFNARCVDMRHLWEPSREYMGKPTDKPNYFGGWLVPKTQAHWSQEPVFGGVMAAFNKLLQGQLQHFAQNPNAVVWPISDGDFPSATGKTSDFAKGHWLFGASTGNVPNIELVQAGAQAPVKLLSRAGVKPGDYCMLGVTAAVKQNQPNGVKFYLNACVFTHPGEEIVFANSVSGAELMRTAQAQGLHIQGFAPNGPGFGGGAPQGGFPGAGGPGGFAPPAGGGFGAPGPGQAPGGFGGSGPGGFTPGGAPGAPMTGPGGFAGPATAPNGAGFGGGAASPFNQPQGFHPAQAPQGAPPAGPFGGPPQPGSWPQR